MRINKYLADAGVCSRRKADELVLAGVVRVNGQSVDSPGTQIEQGDIVEVRGKRITPVQREPAYIMLNKPVRVVSTASDPEGRETVLDLLPPALTEHGARRLYPVGRLDFFSEGLILITDDGELTNALVHPRHHVPRVYHVLVRGVVPPQYLEQMRTGMTLQEGERLAPVEVRVLASREAQRNDATLLELVLHQGINRQIRRMCRDMDLTVLRLTRVAQGPLELGDLSAGQARKLTPREVAAIRKATGLDRSQK